MEFSGTVVPTLTSIAVQLPLLLVWLVGVILAFVHWGRHPKVSLLFLIATLMLFLRLVAGTWVGIGLVRILHWSGMGITNIGLVQLGSRVLLSLIGAVAWGLLLVAVFGWRKQAKEGRSWAEEQTFSGGRCPADTQGQ
jgi:hypothetical protein